jgi:polygalacturonase
MSLNGEISRRVLLQGAVGLGALGPLSVLPPLKQPSDSLNANDFGATGDGRTDDTRALQTAMDQAAQEQRPLYLPSGSYIVTNTLVASSNLTIVGDDATIVTAIDEYGNSSRPVPTLQINDASNVTLQGLKIDGRGDAYYHNEYKHCVSIQGSDKVLIENCDFIAAKGDGLILNDLQSGAHNRNITVRRTKCTGNFRLGLAVTDVESALFEDCEFTNNRGTSPMAGVDIEPDRGDCQIDNIVFKNCVIAQNGIRDRDGAGVNVALVAEPIAFQGNIRFEACTISDNGIQGVLCYNSRDLQIMNCQITYNGSSGLEIFRSSSNIEIEGGSISGNAVYGVSAVRESKQILTNLRIHAVAIENNSLDAPGEYDGVHLQGRCREVEISDCTISGTHRYGIWLGELTEDISLIGNDLGGNSSGATYPSDSGAIG